MSISHRARKEQERLERNRERTKKREKQKKMQQKIKGVSVTPSLGGFGGDNGSPEPSIEKATGTTRKCANCGQIGHIKTNKKLCPKLNGSLPRDSTAEETPGLGAIGSAPVAAGFVLS